MTELHFLPGGKVRAIFDDTARKVFPNLMPRRASRVEVIPEGKHKGRFHVDFTLLSEQTGRAEHAVCLARPFDSYKEAVEAEVAWLKENYVHG